MAALHGHCLCGNLRYTADDQPFASDYCHCTQCTRGTGAFAVCWMDFNVSQLHWLGDKPTEYASSENIRRGFCANCGSTLSYRHIQHPDYISVSVATLADPSLVQPTYHIHTESQVSWLNIVDGCPRYEKGQQ